MYQNIWIYLLIENTGIFGVVPVVQTKVIGRCNNRVFNLVMTNVKHYSVDFNDEIHMKTYTKL